MEVHKITDNNYVSNLKHSLFVYYNEKFMIVDEDNNLIAEHLFKKI